MSSALPGNRNRSRDVFGIDDEPLPTIAYALGDNSDALQILESDIKRLLRRIAELEFSRAEAEKQNSNMHKRLLLSIIEVLDAFERVFTSIRSKQDTLDRQAKKWVGNFRTIQRIVNGILAEQGVAPIETLDARFDPQWHKVSRLVFDPSKPDGTILEEDLRGYCWRNMILRKPEVAVSCSSEDEADREGGPAEEASD